MKVEIYSAIDLPWSEVKTILNNSTVAGLPNAEKTFSLYYAASNLVWIGKINGQIVCIYGLMGQCFLTRSAYMWMLHTKALEDNKFLFVRHSQCVIEEGLKIYDEIIGHVKVDNLSGQRWLKWLGAEFSHSCLAEDAVMPFVIRKKSWPIRSQLA